MWRRPQAPTPFARVSPIALRVEVAFRMNAHNGVRQQFTIGALSVKVIRASKVGVRG